MRGVFGMLLIGGGVVLMYGLFTGKITIPFNPSTSSSSTSTTTAAPSIGLPVTTSQSIATAQRKATTP